MKYATKFTKSTFIKRFKKKKNLCLCTVMIKLFKSSEGSIIFINFPFNWKAAHYWNAGCVWLLSHSEFFFPNNTYTGNVAASADVWGGFVSAQSDTCKLIVPESQVWTLTMLQPSECKRQTLSQLLITGTLGNVFFTSWPIRWWCEK